MRFLCPPILTFLLTVFTSLLLPLASSASWVEDKRVGKMHYFLTASPAQIARYNLETSEWLEPRALPSAVEHPVTFTVSANQIFVATTVDDTYLYRLSLSGEMQQRVDLGNRTLFCDGVSYLEKYAYGLEISKSNAPATRQDSPACPCFPSTKTKRNSAPNSESAAPDRSVILSRAQTI